MPAKPSGRVSSRPFFFEPLRAAKVTVDRPPFKAPRDVDEDIVADMRAKYEREDRDAEVLIWGSDVCEPAKAWQISTGQMVDCPTEGIVARYRRIATFKEGVPRHEEFSARIVDCVNAMAGIADPVGFMAELHDFLLCVANHEAGDAVLDGIVTSNAAHYLGLVNPSSNRLLRRPA